MTGIVDEVVCKGGNCTALALGQRMISTGHGHVRLQGMWWTLGVSRSPMDL